MLEHALCAHFLLLAGHVTRIAAFEQQNDLDVISVALNGSSHVSDPNAEIDFVSFLRTINTTLLKYDSGYLPPLSEPSLARRTLGPGHVDLMGIASKGHDVNYLADLTVGKHQLRDQTFKCMFDTGSFLITVPGPKCGIEQGCGEGNRYNERGLQTGVSKALSYGNGGSSVEGEIFTDEVNVAGYTATDTELLSISKAQPLSSDIQDAEFVSLMGMGISKGASSNTSPTWFENLVDQEHIEPEFSFFFGRSLSHSSSRSLLSIGGREPSRFEGPVYTESVSDAGGHWQVAINDVQVDGRSAGVRTAGEAIIDTGTNIIFAPMAAAAAIFDLIPGSFALDISVASGQRAMKAYIFPCDLAELPIAFGLAGQWLPASPLDLNMGRFTATSAPYGGVGRLPPGLRAGLRFKQYCTSAVVGQDVRSAAPNRRIVYVIGQAFLKSVSLWTFLDYFPGLPINWYSIFRIDGPTVSFAAAVHN